MFGSLSLSEIILSWIISLFINNVFIYFQLSLVRYHLLSVSGFICIFAAQIVFIAPLAYVAERLYFHLNPAHNAIIIYGKKTFENTYNRPILKNSRKFKINRALSQDEPVEVLFQLINESDSVFLLDVDETLKDMLLKHCFIHNKRAYIMPTFSGALINTAEISWISNTPMFLPKDPMPQAGAMAIKRAMDIFISLTGILITFWLMLIIWALIRLYDNGPAVFKQTRITKDGKLFVLYKFRSMRLDAEKDGIARLASKNDVRVTPIGRFLRKFRLDELPQLFNVLSGSMSIVGPRPERPELASKYEQIYPDFSFRTKVKAGLTGFAQVYGKYNTPPDVKLFLDIIYIERFSIWEDVKLIFQTFKTIFICQSAEGVDEEAEAHVTKQGEEV
jgi:lipopolysaccharide/colanic/teichoic acid biosynthesis glycosyltransferase